MWSRPLIRMCAMSTVEGWVRPPGFSTASATRKRRPATRHLRCCREAIPRACTKRVVALDTADCCTCITGRRGWEGRRPNKPFELSPRRFSKSGCRRSPRPPGPLAAPSRGPGWSSWMVRCPPLGGRASRRRVGACRGRKAARRFLRGPLWPPGAGGAAPTRSTQAIPSAIVCRRPPLILGSPFPFSGHLLRMARERSWRRQPSAPGRGALHAEIRGRARTTLSADAGAAAPAR